MPAPARTTLAPNADPARDPALDGLRGIAILLVYLFHYGGGLRSTHLAVRAFGRLTQAGWVGVQLFFALSGFLITRLLWADLPHAHVLRNFYARRALRILPLYFAALLTAAAAAVLAGARPFQLSPLLLYAGFLQNIPTLVPLALQYPAPLPLHHLWTLAVEEQFYLLWPFCLRFVRGRRAALKLCLSLFALSCFFRICLWYLAPRVGFAPATWSASLPTQAGALVLGAALALLPTDFLISQTLARGTSLVVLVCGLLAFAIGGARSGSLLLSTPLSFVLGLPGIAAAATALVALALRPGWFRAGLSTPALGLLGRVSYGFYILHILLEPLFDRIGSALAHATSGSLYQLVRLLVAFPVSLAAAWLSFRFLEQPFLRLKQHFPHPAEPSA